MLKSAILRRHTLAAHLHLIGLATAPPSILNPPISPQCWIMLSDLVVSTAMGLPLYRWMVFVTENPIVRNGWWYGVPPWLRKPPFELQNVCCTDPTLSRTCLDSSRVCDRDPGYPGYPGYPTFFDHRPAFSADQVDDLLRSCLSCLEFQIWTDPEDASGKFWTSQSQYISMHLFEKNMDTGLRWTQSLEPVIFSQQHFFGKQAQFIRGAQAWPLRKYCALLNQRWAGCGLQLLPHLHRSVWCPYELWMESRGIPMASPWHPHGMSWQNVERCGSRTLLNASVRTSESLEQSVKPWMPWLITMLKGPLLPFLAKFLQLETALSVPITDSWASYLLYMGRISKDPMHTPRQSVSFVRFISARYTQVWHIETLRPRGKHDRFGMMFLDTTEARECWKDSERTTDILIWWDWKITGAAWATASGCRWNSLR